jgi:Zn-dependent protease
MNRDSMSRHADSAARRRFLHHSVSQNDDMATPALAVSGCRDRPVEDPWSGRLADFWQDWPFMSGEQSSRRLWPASLSLGRIAGIPIGLHYSWFLIALLIALSLASQFRMTRPEWTTERVWIVSVVTAVLFFVTLLAHELSHALVARSSGIPVRSITLFALGGVASIEKEGNNAKTEFFIAVVGPIVSALIGFLALAAARGMGWSPEGGASSATANVLGWLGSINVVLAVFNLVPGYPLDGGRILRAILWGIYKDGQKATRHAARVGEFVAALFIAIGVLRFFGGAGFGGLWIAFIGWFLLTAAQASYAQATLGQSLRGLKVADIMANDCVTVDAATPLQRLVEDVMLRTGRRCVIVQRDHRLAGLLTPNEIRHVDRDRWLDVTAGDVMRPLDGLHTVTPETSVDDALNRMAREDVNQLPVVDHGRLEGMVSRGQILQLLQSRAELGA